MHAPAGKSFEEILQRLKAMRFAEKYDFVVAIAAGGIIPAALLARLLGCEMQILRVNFRDAAHRPKYAKPKLLRPLDFDVSGKTVLVADDRVKSGATLALAKDALRDSALVKTFAVNGAADYSLYDEACFPFPWNA